MSTKDLLIVTDIKRTPRSPLFKNYFILLVFKKFFELNVYTSSPKNTESRTSSRQLDAARFKLEVMLTRFGGPGPRSHVIYFHEAYSSASLFFPFQSLKNLLTIVFTCPQLYTFPYYLGSSRQQLSSGWRNTIKPKIHL